MDPKPDKDYENRDDIGLLSEIIANSTYWQSITSAIPYSHPFNFFRILDNLNKSTPAGILNYGWLNPVDWGINEY